MMPSSGRKSSAKSKRLENSAKEREQLATPQEEDSSDYQPYFPRWPVDDIKHTVYLNPAEAKAFKEAKTVSWPWDDPRGKVWVPTGPSQPTILWTRAPDFFKDRLAEGVDPVVVSPRRFQLVESTPVLTQSETAWLRKKNLMYPAKHVEQHANLIASNVHILHIELMRTLVTHFNELQRMPNMNAPHRIRPWELIWPQTINSQGQIIPAYNPAGKYIVKLFWLQSWRYIEIDDYVPHTEDGKLLYLSSPMESELWPLLVSKAIAKLTFMNSDTEFSEANTLQILTGWYAETIPASVTPEDNDLVTRLMHDKALKPLSDQPIPIVKKPTAIKTEEDLDVDTKDAVAPSQSPTTKRSGRKAAIGNRTPLSTTPASSPLVPGTPASTQQDTTNEHLPAMDLRIDELTYIGATSRLIRSDASAITGDISLNPEEGFKATYDSSDALWDVDPGFHFPIGKCCKHTARVLECIYIPEKVRDAPIDTRDVSNWVVRCQSGIATFKGQLAYDSDSGWTSAFSLGCGISPASQLLKAEAAVKAMLENESHELFEWHMTLTEFYRAFEDIVIHHKLYDQPIETMEVQVGSKTAEIVSHGSVDKFKEDVVSESDMQGALSAGQSYYLCVDSTSPVKALISFSVSPWIRKKVPSLDHEVGTTPISSASRYGLVLERFNWKTTSSLDILAEARTNSDSSSTITVPAGMNMYRIIPAVSGSFAFSFATVAKSDAIISIKNEHSAFQFLSVPSVRLQVMAMDVCKVFDSIFRSMNSEAEIDTNKIIEKLRLLHNVLGENIGDTILLLKSVHSAMNLTLDGVVLEGTPDDRQFQFFDENRQYLRCGLVWHRVILMLTKLVEDHLVPKIDDSIAAPQSDVKISIVKAFGSEDDPEHHHRYRLQPRPPSVARIDSGSKSESASSRHSRPKSAGSSKLSRPSSHASSISNTSHSTHVHSRNSSEARANSARTHSSRSHSRPQSRKRPKTPTMDEKQAAAVWIQTLCRKRMAQKRMAMLRAAQVVLDHNFFIKSWDRIVQSNMLDFGVLMFRRYADMSPSGVMRLPFAPDEALRGHYNEFTGVVDGLKARHWSMLFSDTLRFNEATILSVALRTAKSNDSGDGYVPIDNSFHLNLINNDTLEPVQRLLAQPVPWLCTPNKRGYTISAFGKAALPIEKLLWGVRLLTSSPLNWQDGRVLRSQASLPGVTKTGMIIPKTAPGSGALIIDPLTGVSQTIYDVLFHYKLDVESIDSSAEVCSLYFGVDEDDFASVKLELQVSRGDEVICRVEGKHSLSVPLMRLEGPGLLDEVGEVSQVAEKENEHPETVSPEPSSSSYVPYIVRGRMVVGLDSIPKNASDNMQSDTSPKKRSTKGSIVSGPLWTFKIHADVDVKVEDYNDREQEIQIEKDGWEIVDEGRGDRALKVRNSYIEASSTDDPKHADHQTTNFTGDTSSIQTFDDSIRLKNDEDRRAQLKEFKEQQNHRRNMLSKAAERRSLLKNSFKKNIVINQQKRVNTATTAAECRRAYRDRLADEDQAAQLLEGLRQAACEAEMEARYLHDPSAAAKKGKKKK